MGRPRKWESNAERMRATRAPAENSAENSLTSQHPPYEKLIAPEKSLPAKHILSESEYVTREVEITRRQMQIASLKDTLDTKGRGRLERAERYARWRYRSFLAGEVASL